MKYKPSFIIVDENEKEGIHVLYRYFVTEKGFDLDAVRTLVVKYPYILSKTEDHLRHFFQIFSDHGLSEEAIMKQLIDCPKLISMNIDK